MKLVLLGNCLMRLAGGASGVLMGLYFGDQANRGSGVSAAFVGLIGAAAFGAELIAAFPMGLLADVIAPRTLMTAGGLIGGGAIHLLAWTRQLPVFFFSRSLEGIAAAAGAPSTLAYLVDETERDKRLRGRVMSYFELSLLAGIALGGPLGSQLWTRLGLASFAAVSFVYWLSSACFVLGTRGIRTRSGSRLWTVLKSAFKDPSIRRLAPSWLCINAIIGLWLGPVVVYLLTRTDSSGQYLAGLFSSRPEDVGWLFFTYFVTFGLGVTGWSFVLHRIARKRVLVIALSAMLAVCIGLYFLNHSQSWPAEMRWLLLAAIAASVMVESGFTPAALALLADMVGSQGNRGTAMGIYSALLGVGALLGALIASALAARFAIDELIFGTLALALIAMTTLRRLDYA